MATNRNRPSLARQTSRSADSQRRRVAIEGRCSIGDREAQDVLVTDLGATGCRLSADAVGVTKSDPLELWLGEAGPLAGKLKWIKDGAFGVSFETPLQSAELDELYAASQTSNIVPLRK